MLGLPHPRSFRDRLTIALVLLVIATTSVSLYMAHRRESIESEKSLQREFHYALAAAQQIEEARLLTLVDRCRRLAKSVRVRTALEENAVEELYVNAAFELRDLLEQEGAEAAMPGQIFSFRFLDANGRVIPPGAPELWESSLQSDGPPARQQTGYVEIPSNGGTNEVVQIVSAPVVREDTGELLGAVVLRFKPKSLESLSDLPLHNGIWIGGRLYLPSLPKRASLELERAIAGRISTGVKDGSLRANLDGAPQLLFYKQVNPDGRFPPACEISLYPLTDSVARLIALRWQILGTAAALALAGFVASHFLSERLSAPVEKLELKSAENEAGRERAEAALELTNEELRARNAELQQAIADLKAAQQRLVQQERLRALGQMASGIAHDFNNALVPILGFCELLQISPTILSDRKKAATYLETIQTAARDASSVVSRLREFYRTNDEDERFTPIDLRNLIAQAIQLTQPKWKGQAQADGATIEVISEAEPTPPIAGSESCLREMLTNLIFNAVDAMPNGGRITLRAFQSDGAAKLEVADTGTGMTEEVRRRCLEPFFSTKGERGTGLGLSMVFGIVQRHGGEIDLESQPGRGTTFKIRFPILSVERDKTPETAPAPASRALRVLVVDDEAAVRDLLRETLVHDGHSVELAEHGVDGLRQFMRGDFDLVVTDKAMPGMSGDQLAAEIKKARPQTPIVLLTGFGQFMDKMDRPNVDVVAPKPIGITELRNAIATAVKIA